MDRILELPKKRWPVFCVLMVTIAFLSAVQVTAANYQGWMTGYAFGHVYGASGAVIMQTDFANHSPEYCPGDPAAYWPWGTYISLVSNPSVIYLSNAQGQYRPVTSFDLWDNGDPSCSMGNYWVDIYFGRYTIWPSYCDCPGSPPGSCVYGVKDSCEDAMNFGRHWATYQK
jgi:hypothetical protein